MAEVDAKNVEMQQKMKQMFNKEVNDVMKRFFDKYNSSSSICSNIESSVMQCYMENGATPLHCRQVADDYRKCVLDYRKEQMARNSDSSAGSTQSTTVGS